MVQKASTKLVFKTAWEFPYEVERRIANFVNKHYGNWLHAPVGMSKLATGIFQPKTKMLTLDIDEKVNPDILCDVFDMHQHPQIKEVIKTFGGFDGVISDPLWYDKLVCSNCNHIVENPKGLSYPDRRWLSYEVRDVLKPGGWWLFNGLWNPRVKGLSPTNPHTNPTGTPYEIPMQQFSSFRNVSLLIYCQRKNQKLS